jgi:hypothetical protein
MDMQGVHCEVGTEFLNVKVFRIYMNLMLHAVK